jgi:hypothetical protein
MFASLPPELRAEAQDACQRFLIRAIRLYLEKTHRQERKRRDKRGARQLVHPAVPVPSEGGQEQSNFSSNNQNNQNPESHDHGS